MLNEQDKQEYLNKFIKDQVDQRLKLEGMKGTIKCDIDAAAEKLEVSTTYLRKLIDLQYQRDYDGQKFDNNLMFLEDVVEFFSDEPKEITSEEESNVDSEDQTEQE